MKRSVWAALAAAVALGPISGTAAMERVSVETNPRAMKVLLREKVVQAEMARVPRVAGRKMTLIYALSTNRRGKEERRGYDPQRSIAQLHRFIFTGKELQCLFEVLVVSLDTAPISIASKETELERETRCFEP